MIRINKTGWVYIALTILVGFAAVNTANNLIYILASALLSYMLVSGIFGRKNIHALEVQVMLPEEIYARTPTPITVRLHNPRRLLPALLIRVRLGEREVLFPYVAPASVSERSLTLILPHRGRHRLDRLTLASPFPFNFFLRSRSLSHATEVLAFPKPIPWPAATAFGEAARGGDRSSDALGESFDILAIRNYLPGDPIKRIHWKSTAKTDQLHTKDYAAVDEPDVVIDVDRIALPNLEDRLSCTTARVLQLAREQRAFGLRIGGRLIAPARSPAHKRALLRILATYDPA